MSLAPGTRIGVHEIVALIGAGGMGEVYRARDTRLKRDVAIKILPEAFSNDPERLARFQREAEVIASLNHPYIAQIHGLEESNGIRALVLELVEGETLAERIARGAIPIDEALPIARQIAEALEGAHERGIIHRDLKPANIKITPDGTVKVLDFGLAKLADPSTPDGGRQPSGLSQSPTITSPALVTGGGVLLGTAAYMSPEQARGKAVDKRADIWAFGCVLYEMLSGKRAFHGEDVTDTLATIVKSEPDWRQLPADITPSLRRLLSRCLRKPISDRLQAIGDARVELSDLIKGEPQLHVVTTSSRSGRQTVVTLAALGVFAALGALSFSRLTPRPALPAPTSRVSIDIGPNLTIDANAGIAISPDGRVIAFSANEDGGTQSRLYTRRVDEWQPQAVAGAEGASAPYFSPDGEWIVFSAGRQLKKVAVRGGAATVLYEDASTFRGAAWRGTSSIVFQPRNRSALVQISAEGGRAEEVTTVDPGEVVQRWPQILPGENAVLFVSDTAVADFDDASIVVQRLPRGPRKVVLRGAQYARYLPTGHLLYIHRGTLFAARFNLQDFSVIGAAVPLLEGIAIGSSSQAQFDVSASGTVVYLAGGRPNRDAPLQWFSRQGRITELRRTAANWANLRIAPDGRQLAMDLVVGGVPGIWLYEWGTDRMTRFTTGIAAEKPVWTPDGQRIAFAAASKGSSNYNLYWQRADGAGEAQRLTESSNFQGPSSWHPSGAVLAFWENFRETRDDILLLRVEGSEAAGWTAQKPTAFLRTPFAERAPVFSPDGRWIAYSSDESGREELYVRPYPGPGAKTLVSTNGALTNNGSIVWSSTRQELFYPSTDRRVMVVDYAVKGTTFSTGKPRPVSDTPFLERRRSGPTRSFDLHPDGERFALSVDPVSDQAERNISVIFNVFDELRRLTETKSTP